MDRGAWRATVHGVTKSDTTEQPHTEHVNCPSTPLSSPSLISHLSLISQSLLTSLSHLGSPSLDLSAQ